MQRVAATVLGLALALAGCGPTGEVQAVEDVMDRHVEGIAAGDGRAACADLTAAARRGVVESVHERIPELGVKTCEEALGGIAGELDATQRNRIREARIDVEVNGDRAVADSEATVGKTYLRKQGDRWVITRIDFGR